MTFFRTVFDLATFRNAAVGALASTLVAGALWVVRWDIMTTLANAQVGEANAKELAEHRDHELHSGVKDAIKEAVEDAEKINSARYEAIQVGQAALLEAIKMKHGERRREQAEGG